jgi:hypothetical protein
MVAGLLEGAAFLAARVQLKLKHIPEFTANLLEQLVPNYLAPTLGDARQGAAALFRPGLRDGKKIPVAPISTHPTANASAASPAVGFAAKSFSGRSM